MLKRDIAYLSLGSNIGNRKEMILKAKKELVKLKISVDKESPLYVTEPVGKTDQEKFLNQVIRIRTSLEPLKLLIFIKNIESKLGRSSNEKWGPREIDIDILFYNDIIMKSDQLVIPHPEIQNRRFILVPMKDIAPDLVHPVLKKDIKTLLSETADTSGVQKSR
jgi:2-amino-4-hydroxy-6-hydroxymethyldihydropteridine diphosphokinase